MPFLKYEVFFFFKNRSIRYISIYHKIGNIKGSDSALGIKAKKDNVFQALKENIVSTKFRLTQASFDNFRPILIIFIS